MYVPQRGVFRKLHWTKAAAVRAIGGVLPTPMDDQRGVVGEGLIAKFADVWLISGMSPPTTKAVESTQQT